MHSFDNKEAAVRAAAADSDTARLIDLCADQIRTALDEAFREIDALSGAVLDIARHASDLLSLANAQDPDASSGAESGSARYQALQLSVQNACIRLQFSDRLNQRLSNVAKNLTNLAKLMNSSDVPITEAKWAGFLDAARITFTTELERNMFDAVFRPSAIESGNDSAANAFQDLTLFDGDTRDGA